MATLYSSVNEWHFFSLSSVAKQQESILCMVLYIAYSDAGQFIACMCQISLVYVSLRKRCESTLSYFWLTLVPLNSLHAGKFCMLFCCMLTFFNMKFWKNNSFRTTILVSNNLSQDQSNFLSGLICIHTVCKGFQQTTKADKGLIHQSYISTDKLKEQFWDVFLTIIYKA